MKIEKLELDVWRIIRDDGSIEIVRTSKRSVSAMEEAAKLYEAALCRLASR